MHSPEIQIPPSNRGFTVIELLIVIAIIIVLTSILIPALGKAFATAKSAEDKSKLKGLHAAFLLDATGSDGRLPQPSELGNVYTTVTHDTTDTTSNLMSLMIARNYFTTDYLISPVESNPNILDMNGEDFIYNYASVDGEEIFWDTEFEGNIAIASASNPAHNSYAHQALCGERVRLKWHSGASSSDIIASNRGPEVQIDGITFNSDSHTLKFHGEEELWKGNIVCGDGSTRMIDSFFPEGIAYQPLNGMPLGPDNIFTTDWNDIQITGTTAGMPSGDNWMVICAYVQNENEIMAVWD